MVFLPYTLPAAGIGPGVQRFLQFNGGLNGLLPTVGLGVVALDWLGSPTLAIYSVGES